MRCTCWRAGHLRQTLSHGHPPYAHARFGRRHAAGHGPARQRMSLPLPPPLPLPQQQVRRPYVVTLRRRRRLHRRRCRPHNRRCRRCASHPSCCRRQVSRRRTGWQQQQTTMTLAALVARCRHCRLCGWGKQQAWVWCRPRRGWHHRRRCRRRPRLRSLHSRPGSPSSPATPLRSCWTTSTAAAYRYLIAARRTTRVRLWPPLPF